MIDNRDSGLLFLAPIRTGDRNDPFPPRVETKGETGDHSSESAAPFFHSLDSAMDYDSVFSVVRKAVRFVLKKERSGLGLMLSDLPSGLGAFWEVGGNYIVLNESLVEVMRTMAKSVTEFNSYVFVVLAHEYLHSIGYIDENDVRRVTARVVGKSFGDEHPATAMAVGDLWQMYPFLRFAEGGRGTRARIVGKFDTESTRSYIW